MVNVLTFDVETTHTEKRGGGYSPLPYFGNRLVSIGYKWLQSRWHTTATIIRRSRQLQVRSRIFKLP